MATNISQEDFQKTALRLPKDLHERLHESAKESGRSYNAEIVARLANSFIDNEEARLAAEEAGKYKIMWELSSNREHELSREKADMQAQLAAKDAKIQVLRERIHRGNYDSTTSVERVVNLGDLPAMLLRLEAQMAGQREVLETIAASGVNARLYPDGKLASVIVGESSERGVSVQLEHPTSKKMREEGRLPSQQRLKKPAKKDT